MKVLIVGCGYLGTALGEKLVSQHVEVWGLRRDEDALAAISKKGIWPLKADLLAPLTLKNLPSADVIVICQGLSRETDNYESTYEKATANLISALRSHTQAKLILISSTGVYAAHDGSWVDETTNPGVGKYNSPESADNAHHLLRMENKILSCGLPAMVLRLAGIYGPGRHRLKSLKEGRIKPSLSETYTNRIHRDDIVEAIQLLIKKGKSGEIYLGADDHPSTQKEFYSWIYEQMNLPLPENVSTASEAHAHISNRRVSNRKIKALGLTLKYPSFQEGYAELLKETV